LTRRVWHFERVLPFSSRGLLVALKGGRWLAKLYEEPLPEVERERITWLARVGQGAIENDRPDLRQICWPYDLVVDDAGRVEGVVLPRASSHFFDGQEPRQLDRLISARSDTVLAQRLRVVRTLAAVLEFLERGRNVHGDIAPGNVLWAPTGEILLVDADGLSGPMLPSQLKRPGTPHWQDPRISIRFDDQGRFHQMHQGTQRITSHDFESDAFGLFLAVYRAICQSATADPCRNGALPDVDCAVTELLRQVTSDPVNMLGSRPTPTEWKAALDEALASPATIARLDRWSHAVNSADLADRVQRNAGVGATGRPRWRTKPKPRPAGARPPPWPGTSPEPDWWRWSTTRLGGRPGPRIPTRPPPTPSWRARMIIAVVVIVLLLTIGPVLGERTGPDWIPASFEACELSGRAEGTARCTWHDATARVQHYRSRHALAAAFTVSGRHLPQRRWSCHAADRVQAAHRGSYVLAPAGGGKRETVMVWTVRRERVRVVARIRGRHPRLLCRWFAAGHR
jgi:hypothetical protein